MNKFSFLSIALCLWSVFSVNAQKKDKVLFTLDGTPIYTKEFKQVYNKNLELVKDEGQKIIEGYLEMFVNYKLKVKEAYAQKFHESPNYIKDFAKYEEQLSRNYIYEDKLTSELAREGYERSLEEIDVSHILIKSNYGDVPQDTLKAYKKIEKIRNRVLNGEDFTKLAKETSEEPNANRSGGHLGYFTAFAFVYPFETMAYNTKVGDVSEIVRTEYGYHIIKIHDRKKKENEITVSHIMISAKKDSTTTEPKKRIDEIYALLQQGGNFESLAKQYSDDKNSAKNDGKLRRFSKGQLRSKSFEEEAYRLTKVGETSKPIKTEFGWHIIRLEELHAQPTFEEKKAELEKQVATGNRSKIVTTAVKNKIKERYKYVVGEDYKVFFSTFVNDDVLKRQWDYEPLTQAQNKRLFSIEDRDVTYNDFAAFIKKRQSGRTRINDKMTLLAVYYDEFETEQLKKYFRNQLENENEEYANIISEYRDGLLIFEVMGKNVWEKAKKDTIAQKSFFEENKDKYQWKKRVDVEIISSQEKEVVLNAASLFSENKTGIQIKSELNTNKIKAILTEGVYEIDSENFPEGFQPKKGTTTVVAENGAHKVIYVKEIIPAGPKKLEDIRGKVLNDYQNYLEKQWIAELRSKYPIQINKKVLKKLKKELKP